MIDILTIGRSSVDLYGQQHGAPLERMGSFAKYVGGCPTNIAVGASRLGLKSALITRVGGDHMGRYIVDELKSEKVDVSGVVVDPDRLTALVILGIRDDDTYPLIFYREDCADMALDFHDIDEKLVEQARAVLITGTHLSQPGVRAASLKAVHIAKGADRSVIFEIDYRPVLWGLTPKDAGENRFVADAQVTRELQTVAQDCDLIVGTEEEFQILGGTQTTLDAIRMVREITGATLLCKLGKLGCVVFEGAIPDAIDQGLLVPGFSVDVFNVLGAGDGFMAGFLSGWLKGASLEESCRRANACGALVVSRHGCAPAMPSSHELEYFLKHGSSHKVLRLDPKLEQMHWSTNRRRCQDSLSAFAIDHRTQFLQLAEKAGVGLDKIAEFKNLAFDAFRSVADSSPEYGMLVDGEYGQNVLNIASDEAYWIARPIEIPGSGPLRFVGGPDPAVEIQSWPVDHVVKCLVHYHPHDPLSLKQGQEEQVRRVFQACRSLGREFLLEIVASKFGKMSHSTTSEIIRRMYDIGVYPDWWKLEPCRDAIGWRSVEEEVLKRDPFCRGVVILGLSAPLDEMSRHFELAAQFKIVKGFAIGRTIFETAAQDWFAGTISHAEAIRQMADKFRQLRDIWATARLHGATEQEVAR